MALVSSKTHGFLDYLMAGTLIALPFFLSRDKRRGAPQAVATLAGAAIVPQSLFTDYEWGVKPAYSMRAHLYSDIVGAVVFGAAPWIFGFSDRVKWPFVAMAAVELGAVAMSDWNAYQGSTPAPLERVFDQGKEAIRKVDLSQVTNFISRPREAVRSLSEQVPGNA